MLRTSKRGPVEEGAVGADTIAFGFKRGIGTASASLTEAQGGYTVGVLVQTNFGGNPSIASAPVGWELKVAREGTAEGSAIVLIATDAPVDHCNLCRMAARAMIGLARTGSSAANGFRHLRARRQRRGSRPASRRVGPPPARPLAGLGLGDQSPRHLRAPQAS